MISILSPGTDVVLTATDGTLAAGAAEPFVVLGGPTLSIFRLEETNAVVTWRASPNRSYRVETKTRLEDLWEPVEPDVTPTNTTGRLTFPIVSPQKFYRVRVLP